jgi:hypothetical protein
MRKLALLIPLLLCSACYYAPPPPPPPPVVATQPPPGPTPSAQSCREFDTPVVINGQEQEAYGTACLQPDGSWQVQQATPGQPTQTYVVQPQVYQTYYPPAYLANPWYYGPPLFVGGIFIGGGWGYRHGHGGWHGAWHGGHR